MSSRRSDGEPLSRPLLEAWHDQTADSREVQRAYLRFLRRRRPTRVRAPAVQIARWIGVGAMIGVSSVYAATGSLRLLGRSEEVATQPAPSPVAATPSPRVALPLSSPHEAVSAAAVPPPPVPSVVSSAPAPAPPAASSDEPWQRAARGMRERDFETANSALEELARRGSDAERESAQLVRAQLLLSQGRESEGANLLLSLRTSARSATVRQKSAELLARVNEFRPSQRSFAPAEGTNDP